MKKHVHNFVDRIQFLNECFGSYKYKAVILLSTILICGVVEGFGMAMILPLLDTIVGSRDGGFWSQFILNPIVLVVPEKYVILILSLMFLGILILKNLLILFKGAYSIQFSQGIMRVWMVRIKENYLYASYQFILNHKQGYLINNIIGEPNSAGGALGSMIGFLSSLIITSILYIVLLLTNWQATLVISIVFGVLMVATSGISRKYSERFGKKRIELKQDINIQVSENIIALRQIKTFGLEKSLLDRFHNSLNKLVEIAVKFKVMKMLPLAIGDVVVCVILVSIILYLQYGLNYDLKNAIPEIGLFAIVSQRMKGDLTALVAQRMVIFSLIPSLRLVQTLANQKQEQEIYQHVESVSHINGDIVIKDLGFSYGGKNPVFSKLNLTIPLNKMTALIGPSGCGKSTLADLLLGLYMPQKGSISINGQSLSQLNMRDWRELIGFVSQDTFVFNTTIAENIAMGKYGAVEDEICAAAKSAGAHVFITQLPQAYETIVGDRGLKLSGGQRQRIAIARAIIRDPELLIFDEATSALDSETEKRVQKSIEELGKKKTILVIAHRLSTIKNADLVYDLGEMLNNVPKGNI